MNSNTGKYLKKLTGLVVSHAATTSKIGLILGVFIATSVVISVRADQVTTVAGFGPYNVSSGGEFTMLTDPGTAAMLGAYSNGVTKNLSGFPNSFQTFCVERNEYIAPSTTYDVTPNNITVFSGQPLTIGAAYLYEQFALGTLPFYNYSDSPVGSRTDTLVSPQGNAAMLQRAIWYFMGEYGFDTYNNYMNGTVPIVNPFGVYTGSDVGILNLWAPGQPHDPAHAYQDVLVLTAVPEPSMFALASLGAAALLALRRRK